MKSKLIEKTNGRKTESVGILMVLFQAIQLALPDLMDENTGNAIELIISSGMVGTLAHRIWRNRKKIINFITNKFKKNE